MICLCSKGLLQKFDAYTDGQKKAFADWINAARNVQAQAERIARTMEMVQKGERFY